MPLTIYHFRTSPSSRSVELLIQELGLEVEYKVVDLSKGEKLKPEYLKINPQHLVPAIDDDGFILSDSHAIMTYLVSKYGKDDSLYPKDLQKRAVVDHRLHYSNDVFYVLHMTVRRSLILHKTSTEDQINKVKEAQENVEKLLEGHKFMAGDSLTVADYSYVTLMDALEIISPTHGKFPLTKTWLERCKSTMKDFDKINKEGAERIIQILESSSKK